MSWLSYRTRRGIILNFFTSPEAKKLAGPNTISSLSAYRAFKKVRDRCRITLLPLQHIYSHTVHKMSQQPNGASQNGVPLAQDLFEDMGRKVDGMGSIGANTNYNEPDQRVTEEVESLSFGDVGVTLGLKYTRTGDTLVSSKHPGDTSLRDIVPPPAVMSASVIPQTHSDLQPVQDALGSLARTDPSVRLESQDGQLLVHGLGALHLEIVESRLRDEWNVQFEFGKRYVSFREGLGTGVVHPAPNSWSTEVAGKPVTAFVDFEVRPLSHDEVGDSLWDGNIVLAKNGKPLALPDSISNQQDPWANISRGIFNSLSSSPHTSLALSHLHIQVKDFRYPPEAQPSILTGASTVILREWIKMAGSGPIMEPYIRLKITVNDETLGKVVKDLTEHGGEVLDLASDSVTMADGEDVLPYSHDGVYVPPEILSPSASSLSSGDSPSLRRAIHAVAPLSRMLDYSNRLRALSGGHGLFEMANAGFREVSDARRLEILREIGRA